MCLAKCVRPTAGAVPPQATIGMGSSRGIDSTGSLCLLLCVSSSFLYRVFSLHSEPDAGFCNCHCTELLDGWSIFALIDDHVWRAERNFASQYWVSCILPPHLECTKLESYALDYHHHEIFLPSCMNFVMKVWVTFSCIDLSSRFYDRALGVHNASLIIHSCNLSIFIYTNRCNCTKSREEFIVTYCKPSILTVSCGIYAMVHHFSL